MELSVARMADVMDEQQLYTECDVQYAADMPQAVDALGIWFLNSRAYSYVERAAPTATTWRRRGGRSDPFFRAVVFLVRFRIFDG